MKIFFTYKDLYMQISYMQRKFVSWGLEPPEERRQFDADWQRVALDFENIRSLGLGFGFRV